MIEPEHGGFGLLSDLIQGVGQPHGAAEDTGSLALGDPFTFFDGSPLTPEIAVICQRHIGITLSHRLLSASGNSLCDM